MSGQVWLGDVIRALAALTPVGATPDRAVLKSVSSLLGLDVGSAVVSVLPHNSPRNDAFVPDETPPVRVEHEDCAPPPVGQPWRAPASREGEQDSVLAPRTMRELWADDPPRPWSADPPLSEADSERLRLPLPYTPLLRRRTAAAIVHAMVATSLPTAEVAVDRLVDLIAEGKPVTSFPRMVRPSLRFGAHLVLDRCEQMYLFHRDQRHLENVVRDVVGKDATRTATFTRSPLRMRRGTGIPEKGRPVVVVSGFGIPSHPVAVEDWQEYVSQVREKGSRVVALVPFARHRWPQWLLDLMPAVTWDRTSTVGSVRMALDRAS